MLEQQFIAEYICFGQKIGQFALLFTNGHSSTSAYVRGPLRRPVALWPFGPFDGLGPAPF
jgi:hypothetical protein